MVIFAASGCRHFDITISHNPSSMEVDGFRNIFVGIQNLLIRTLFFFKMRIIDFSLSFFSYKFPHSIIHVSHLGNTQSSQIPGLRGLICDNPEENKESNSLLEIQEELGKDS